MNALWQKVNREMVAKILAELEYERTLSAEPLAADRWQITMGSETWQFRATRGIWGWLHIDPASLTTASGAAVEAESARRGLANVVTCACPAEALPFADAHTDAVFPTRNGTWHQVNNVERRWRQIRKAAGLDWVKPDAFRHSVVSEL